MNEISNIHKTLHASTISEISKLMAKNIIRKKYSPKINVLSLCLDALHNNAVQHANKIVKKICDMTFHAPDFNQLVKVIWNWNMHMSRYDQIEEIQLRKEPMLRHIKKTLTSLRKTMSYLEQEINFDLVGLFYSAKYITDNYNIFEMLQDQIYRYESMQTYIKEACKKSFNRDVIMHEAMDEIFGYAKEIGLESFTTTGAGRGNKNPVFELASMITNIDDVIKHYRYYTAYMDRQQESL